MVVIKRVGNRSILLEEVLRTNNNIFISFLISMSICIAATVYCLLSGAPISFVFTEYFVWAASLFVIYGATEKDKCYRIYCDDTDITIIKTTTGADQLAICKAAQELEKLALERNAKEAELEEIARGCK